MTSAPTTSSPPRDEPLAAVRRQSGARAVYDLLRQRIIDGTLTADARLTEPVLSAQLGVSRTPVREALRLLQAEALVVEQPTGGVRVAPLAVADLHRVYDVRARLEGLLARDACERARPDDVARLSRLVDLMDAVRDHEDEVLRIGAQFHGEIAALADNRWCSELLRQIRGHVDRYRSLSARERVGTTDHVDEHRDVARAIASGDPDAAERAMREHIERSGAAAAKALGDSPSPTPG